MKALIEEAAKGRQSAAQKQYLLEDEKRELKSKLDEAQNEAHRLKE